MSRSNYTVITDERALDAFIDTLPDTRDDEVYYICLFGRHKYCPSFPNTRDSGQLARVFARKSDVKEKIQRLEVPLGAYSRDGVTAPQECLAAYIGLNPRSMTKANKAILVEFARRVADGDTGFNPQSVVNTEVHRALGRKLYVDFDFDGGGELSDTVIQQIVPRGSYRKLRTRGGYHVIVDLSAVRELKTDWYRRLQSIPGCDVTGAKGLTPIPGCTQGGFTPYFEGTK